MAVEAGLVREEWLRRGGALLLGGLSWVSATWPVWCRGGVRARAGGHRVAVEPGLSPGVVDPRQHLGILVPQLQPPVISTDGEA